MEVYSQNRSPRIKIGSGIYGKLYKTRKIIRNSNQPTSSALSTANENNYNTNVISLENYEDLESEKLINSPRSLEALKLEGIVPQELLYKPIMNESELSANKDLLELRFQFRENKRLELLNIARNARDLILKQMETRNICRGRPIFSRLTSVHGPNRRSKSQMSTSRTIDNDANTLIRDRRIVNDMLRREDVKKSTYIDKRMEYDISVSLRAQNNLKIQEIAKKNQEEKEKSQIQREEEKNLNLKNSKYEALQKLYRDEDERRQKYFKLNEDKKEKLKIVNIKESFRKGKYFKAQEILDETIRKNEEKIIKMGLQLDMKEMQKRERENELKKIYNVKEQERIQKKERVHFETFNDIQRKYYSFQEKQRDMAKRDNMLEQRRHQRSVVAKTKEQEWLAQVNLAQEKADKLVEIKLRRLEEKEHKINQYKSELSKKREVQMQARKEIQNLRKEVIRQNESRLKRREEYRLLQTRERIKYDDERRNELIKLRDEQRTVAREQLIDNELQKDKIRETMHQMAVWNIFDYEIIDEALGDSPGPIKNINTIETLVRKKAAKQHNSTFSTTGDSSYVRKDQYTPKLATIH